MKQILLILAFTLTFINIGAQTSYVGFIDTNPIELLTTIYSDGDARAIYCYTNFDEPIVITGNFKNGKLTLFETNNNKKTASLQFDNFNSKSNKLEGAWTDLKTKKELKIIINKSFDIEHGDSVEWLGREIIQGVSLDNKYFKLIVSKTKNNYYAKVNGVKIVEKKTDKLLQQINLDCQLLGLNNISIDDYNFDGIMDFSVFEASYAGPNTSSLYFLYDDKTNKYIESGFSGVSLEFNSHLKRIFERNQCCAGASVTTAEYKVVENNMVLIKKHCFKWDEKKHALVERKIKDCQ